MPDFTFTATAECSRCGAYLSNSTDDCDNCEDYERERYRFFHMHPPEDEEERIETVWAITPVRAWKVLGDIVGRQREDILPWRLQYRGTSLNYAKHSYDVTDEDSLRQPELPNYTEGKI